MSKPKLATARRHPKNKKIASLQRRLREHRLLLEESTARLRQMCNLCDEQKAEIEKAKAVNAKLTKNGKQFIPYNASNWDFGDWSDRILKAVKVKTEFDSQEMTLSLTFNDGIDNIVKEIVEEVIEAFLNGEESLTFGVGKDGLTICEDWGQNQEVIIPWDRLYLEGSFKDIQKAFEKWSEQKHPI